MPLGSSADAMLSQLDILGTLLQSAPTSGQRDVHDPNVALRFL